MKKCDYTYDAVKYFMKMLEIQELKLGGDHQDVAETYKKIADIFETKESCGDNDQACYFYKMHLKFHEQEYGLFDRRTVNVGARVLYLCFAQYKPYEERITALSGKS